MSIPEPMPKNPEEGRSRREPPLFAARAGRRANRPPHLSTFLHNFEGSDRIAASNRSWCDSQIVTSSFQQDDEKDLRNQGIGVVKQHGGASRRKVWIPKCGHRRGTDELALRRCSGTGSEAGVPDELSRLEEAPETDRPVAAQAALLSGSCGGRPAEAGARNRKGSFDEATCSGGKRIVRGSRVAMPVTGYPATGWKVTGAVGGRQQCRPPFSMCGRQPRHPALFRAISRVGPVTMEIWFNRAPYTAFQSGTGATAKAYRLIFQARK